MRPTATTVPTAVCAMAPNSSEAATVVTASEPRTPPTSEITQTTTRRAIPPCAMISPASTKNGTASSGRLSSPPNRYGPRRSEAGDQQDEKNRQPQNQEDAGENEVDENREHRCFVPSVPIAPS